MSERLVKERQAKVVELRTLGVEPYGGRFEGARPVVEAREAYSPLLEGLRTRVAGRLMAMRRHGKSTFADLRDRSGSIQLYFQEDRLGES
ncbi:MAG: lysine--tRNA ligase, partial [Planctomycetes bacterium]|nr:lysine--tRNA ligase [Planctomycetota bacterium]